MTYVSLIILNIVLIFEAYITKMYIVNHNL